MTMCATARRACSPRSTPPTEPSSPRSTAGTGPSSSKNSSPRSTPKSPMDWRFIWSATTTPPTSPPASSRGWKRILGSTCTSPRRTRPGSTRSNDSLPTSPPTCSNAATTAAFRHSNPTSATGSQAGTRTRSPSSGPSPQNRSSNPSNDFYSELPAQDTRKSRHGPLFFAARRHEDAVVHVPQPCELAQCGELVLLEGLVVHDLRRGECDAALGADADGVAGKVVLVDDLLAALDDAVVERPEVFVRLGCEYLEQGGARGRHGQRVAVVGAHLIH